jgi:mono/diheme cytochrome c family protein
MNVLAVALTAWGVGLMLLAQQGAPRSVTNPLANSILAAAEGRVLYNQICQSCHGPAGDGGGDRGPALNRARLTHGNGDADLFRAIRTGISGTQMPPFATLSETQTWQLVTYLRTLASPVAGDVETAGDAGAGETVFSGRAGCASCHQVNGRGGVVGAT